MSTSILREANGKQTKHHINGNAGAAHVTQLPTLQEEEAPSQTDTAHTRTDTPLAYTRQLTPLAGGYGSHNG